MGNTAASLYVMSDDRGVAGLDWGRWFDGQVLVLPAQGVWVPVFAEELLDGPSVAVGIAGDLGSVVVHFMCFDSDVAMATLCRPGLEPSMLVAASIGGLDAIGPPELGELVGEFDGVELFGDLAAWAVALEADTISVPGDAGIFPEVLLGGVLAAAGIPEWTSCRLSDFLAGDVPVPDGSILTQAAPD